MRNPTMKLLFATMVLGGLFGATATRAAAGPIDDYVAAMRTFTPVIEAWADDVDALTHAATAKPELACSAEMADLAIRGSYMAGDLAGTAAAAPDALDAAHADLIAAVEGLSDAAAGACADPRAASDKADAQVELLRDALNKIKVLTEHSLRMVDPPPTVPDPGTGF